MENLLLSSKLNLNRKQLSHGSQKDLFVVVREGTVIEVDHAIQQLKKIGGSINAKNVFGLTPLHIATWRNHVAIVKRLLEAGADPDCRDGESGWSSLHRALHFGHLAVASVLLQAGASLMLEDFNGRVPSDLLSGPLKHTIENDHSSVETEVFCWGSGTNYQLGTGNAHIQKLPGKVDALQGTFTKIVAAAKFHSVAVGLSGELYTWGFGRGGRLGHPDFDIHSGQAAVITPKKVTTGLGSRRVKAIAAAKHHTIVATEGGEVFTWGSNREGQLGYTSVDTQPTPRRVSSLKTKIIDVAAANKHSAAVSASGEVFTWGCNKAGQLGYGTSNSASNYTPRLVEYLKGKVFCGVSASKYHTIVLSSDGEVYTWGHRLVTPRRVIIARNVRKGGTVPLKFHRKERLCVISVTAGMIHSMALAEDGSLFYWVSSDPDLRACQLYSLSGNSIVSISAGKYWSVAVTGNGDVYMWDAIKYKDTAPVPTRLHGVKRVFSACVGETHLLVIAALYHATLRQETAVAPDKSKVESSDGFELEEDFMFDEESKSGISTEGSSQFKRTVPTLKSLCEGVAAESLVEPRNALQILEICDSLGAVDLTRHCEDIIIRNIDFIFTLSTQAVATTAPEILANLEKTFDLKSAESWSSRRLPTPTATFPVVLSSDKEDGFDEPFRLRNNNGKCIGSNFTEEKPVDFLQKSCSVDDMTDKQVRALRKKLQQIEILEAKQLSGKPLDKQQEAKLGTKELVQNALSNLGSPVEREVLIEEKDNSRLTLYTSHKQRRKIKHKGARVGNCVIDVETPTVISSKIGFPDIPLANIKEKGDMVSVAYAHIQNTDKCYIGVTTGNRATQTDKNSSSSKKKNRKGGLSMFLSGALDAKPQEVAVLPPKNEEPAWGGATFSKGSTSFRDIQNEQSKNVASQTCRSPVNKTPGPVSHCPEIVSIRPACFGSFLEGPLSSPIAVPHLQASPTSDGDRSIPPWTSHSTSPGLSRPSLKDIQIQQGKRNQNLSHSPNQGSPSDVSGISRWFKPEIETPSSIRSIQIEEKAVKDLKRYYSSVKIVKSQQ